MTDKTKVREFYRSFIIFINMKSIKVTYINARTYYKKVELHHTYLTRNLGSLEC